MHEPIQLKPFYDRGFRPLKSMSVFWSNNNTIASIANRCSFDNWVEHENMFILVHELDGFLGYFRLKRFITSDSGTALSGTALSGTSLSGTALSGTALSGTSLSGLSFVNKKNDEPCVLSIHQIQTSKHPKGKYILMTIPVDHMVVACKHGLTLKMWF